MGLFRLVTFLLILMACNFPCMAQKDSTIESLQQLPLQYINQLDNKIDKYSNRISSKTEKTLQRLAKWEQKIKKLLERTSPETAARLFNGQTTFTTLLQKLQEGKSIAENYQSKYDSYRDKLTTNLKYLQQQKDNIKGKLIKPVTEASEKLTVLDNNVKNSEALAQFIKERKKLLLDNCIQYIGKSKYLKKISQENFYYIETLRNYKTLFSDSKKAEQTALTILNKIPAFAKFTQENSMLASLFGSPSSNGGGTVASLAGLQTRASVTALIQNQIAAGGPSAQQAIQQNIQQAQSELNKLKDKVLKAGGSSDMDVWDDSSPLGRRGGAPNQQKTKTFLQRIEFGSNLQTTKSSGYLPGGLDIGISVGYKINNRSVIGLGGSYKMGINTRQGLNFSHQALGIRSFLDWKLKKQFFITAGYEMNYNSQFKNIEQLKQYNAWQPMALAGITKKVNVKTKWFKGTSLQLLYDFLYLKTVPVKQSPVVFRVGYNF
jgi:phage shock protein A